MKLSTVTERMGSNLSVEDKKEFTIKASAKAFDVIINAMYTHKIRAVIRELSTNASDSHIEAGTVKPFEVKLPTRLDTEFYVRDFGTGMTEEKIYNLYTVLFDSDKTENNDVTGCLGIGSKAPFSYCKQFTVKSYVDGEAKLYSVFMDETGTPCITKVAEGPTNEENGFKVSLNVRPSDIYEFIREAEIVFEWFDTKPTILGAEFTWNKKKCEIEYNNWAIHDAYANYLVMGNVCYTLEQNYDKLGDLNKLLGLSLVIRAELGEVDIHPSRERLQNTSRTISFLRKTLEDIKTNLTKITQEKIDKEDSLYDACIAFGKFSYTDYIDKITYKGKPLDLIINVNKSYTYEDDDPYSPGNKKTYVKDHALVSLIDGYNKKHRYSKFRPSPNYRFVINDLKIGAYTRTKNLYNNRDNLQYYIVNRQSFEHPVKDYAEAVQKDMDNAFNNFSTTFQVPEKYILYASKLDKPVYDLTRKKRGKVLKFSNMYGSFTSCYTNIDIDENTKGYYVLVKGYDILQTYDATVNYRHFAHFITTCQNLGFKTDFYALKEKDVTKFPKLKPFYTFIKKEFEKFCQKNKVSELLSIKEINNAIGYKLDLFKKIAKHDTQVAQLIKKYTTNNTIISKYQSMNNFIHLDIQPDKIDLTPLKKYELVDYLSSNVPEALLQEYVLFRRKK